MGLDSNAPYQDLTYKVTGIAMQVHRTLRHGLREEVYQNALEIELAQSGIQFVREYQTDVRYHDEVIGIYYLDFWVEDMLVVELKAFSHLTTNEEVAQYLRYMQVAGAKLGLLLNFGRPSLEHRRITCPRSWGAYNPQHDRWLRTEGYKPINPEGKQYP